MDEFDLAQAAEEAGMSLEQYKRFLQLQQLEQQREQERIQRVQRILRDWEEQAEQLKRIYPSFDLGRESKNRDFLALLRAGVSVRQAYEVAHIDEIKAAAMQAQVVNVHVEVHVPAAFRGKNSS